MKHDNLAQMANEGETLPVQESQQDAASDKQPVSTNSAPVEPKISLWGLMVRVTAVIATIGGLVLHLMGYVSHQNYLVTWGIDPGLFPQSTDAIIIEGYYAFIDRTVTILSAIDQHMWEFIWAGIALTMYLFVLSIMLRIGRFNKNNNKNFHIPRIPGWLADFGKSAALVFVGLASIPVALLFVAVPLIIPAYLAESFGKTHATQELTRFMKGCDQKTEVNKCIELHKDGKPIACGFLIDSSESHIALFDINEKRARAMNRENIELFVNVPNSVAKTDRAQCPPLQPSKINIQN